MKCSKSPNRFSAELRHKIEKTGRQPLHAGSRVAKEISSSLNVCVMIRSKRFGRGVLAYILDLLLS